jgi:histidinol-phosphate aminotransferase
MSKINAREEIIGIKPYALGKSLEEIKSEYNLQVIRKMSDNENVYGFSPQVTKAISENLTQIFYYPDGTTSTLISKLANFYEVSENQFIIGNGSEEMIRMLTRAYIRHGDEAIMADITFPRYETNVVIEGGHPIKIPLINGVHDLDQMFEAINDKTKMVFVCNPNNPTGTIVGKDELLHFIGRIPENILVIVDEAYYEYVLTEDYLETVPLLNQFPNLVILRTFSKIYGLAGLRVGYGIMAEDIVTQLVKVKDVFNVNQLAQYAASTALDDQHFIEECARKNAEERVYVTKALTALGMQVYPSETNFLYVCSKQTVVTSLMEKGFLVRGLHMPGWAEALRVTLGTREDNDSFIESIRQFLKESVV